MHFATLRKAIRYNVNVALKHSALNALKSCNLKKKKTKNATFNGHITKTRTNLNIFRIF